jgi:hypothetical protein
MLKQTHTELLPMTPWSSSVVALSTLTMAVAFARRGSASISASTSLAINRITAITNLLHLLLFLNFLGSH